MPPQPPPPPLPPGESGPVPVAAPPPIRVSDMIFEQPIWYLLFSTMKVSSLLRGIFEKDPILLCDNVNCSIIRNYYLVIVFFL